MVITGDNKLTAEAICKQIGVFDSPEGKSLTGFEFSALSHQEQLAMLQVLTPLTSLMLFVVPCYTTVAVSIEDDRPFGWWVLLLVVVGGGRFNRALLRIMIFSSHLLLGCRVSVLVHGSSKLQIPEPPSKSQTGRGRVVLF